MLLNQSQINKANLIINTLRKREFKNLHRVEMECVMDLEYMLVCNKRDLDSNEFNKILNKLNNGEYNQYYSGNNYSSITEEPEVNEVKEYKLSSDNMQYCFF